MDHAPPAQPAVHRDRSPHLIDQLLHDGHAESGAGIIGSRTLVLLGEGLEDVRFEVFPDADPGILDHKTAARGPLAKGGLLHPDRYGAIGPVIFEGVVDDAHEDLLEVERVSDRPCVPQAVCLQLQPDGPLLRQGGQDCHALLQHGAEVKGLLHRRRTAALQPAYLKNIVHQRQQMLRRHTDLLPAVPLPLRVVLTFFQDGQHPQNPVDGRAEVVGHMGEEFTFRRICLPHPFQELHDGLFLLFPRHHGFRDVLMVSVQAAARFFKRPVRHAAAADVDLAQRRVVPGVDHLGPPGFQHLLDRFLHHRRIVGLDALKPVAVTRLRPDVLRHAQEDPHGPVRVHPGLAALLQLDGPDAGPGPLQDVLQALPPLQIASLLELPEQIAPLQGGHNKVRRRMEHI